MGLAHFAIQLSYHGVAVYPALVLGALLSGVVSLPISLLMLRLRDGEFAIGMWVVAAELAHLLVVLDPVINGETGVSMIALNAFKPDAAAPPIIGWRWRRWSCCWRWYSLYCAGGKARQTTTPQKQPLCASSAAACPYPASIIIQENSEGRMAGNVPEGSV